jgi:CDP-diacylglycerol--serine O-phosphatidyltransferase
VNDDTPVGARRTAYVLPAIFTVLNLLLGYYAIAKAVKGEVLVAAILVLVAAVLDKLDGLVARKTGTESDFGRELDSIADVVSFGVAPALISFAWALNQVGRIGWFATFWFLTCGSLRLARFNVQSDHADRRFFVGLPIPMAAAVPMALVISHALEHENAPLLAKGPMTWMFLALLIATALLMVSNVRYHSFKEVGFGRQQRLWVVLVIALVLGSVVAWPSMVLPLLALGYAAHGPVMWLFKMGAPRARRDDHPTRLQP